MKHGRKFETTTRLRLEDVYDEDEVTILEKQPQPQKTTIKDPEENTTVKTGRAPRPLDPEASVGTRLKEIEKKLHSHEPGPLSHFLSAAERSFFSGSAAFSRTAASFFKELPRSIMDKKYIRLTVPASLFFLFLIIFILFVL